MTSKLPHRSRPARRRQPTNLYPPAGSPARPSSGSLPLGSSAHYRPTGATHRSPQKSHRITPEKRLVTVWVMLLLGMVGLTAKLGQLQLVQGSRLQALAQAQQKTYTVPRAARRSMIDRQGNVLAVDRVVYTLYAHPLLFKQSKAAMATALSPVLERPVAELVATFDSQETGLKLVADLPEEVGERIRRMRFDGLELLPQQQRFYPQQALLSQIVGYINVDGDAQAGLEYSLKEQLLYPAVAKGQTPSPFQQAAIAKDNLQLQLTIDSRLQRIAQRSLEATVAQHRAKRGALIVMDSRNGEILTLAVTPTYDPNRYYDAKIEQFKNWAISDLYEPGSTFKPINVAIALEAGTVGPDDYFFDEGRLMYGPWTIKNSDYNSAGGRGSISITDIMRHSSNVGMVHIMETLERPVFYDWLERLGLGKPTGIELPAESTAQLKDREQFVSSPVEAATTAFGQGFSLTPVQLVQLHGALANGGKLVTPHVVRGLVDRQGQLTWQPERPQPQQIFSPENTRHVLDMMAAVVESGSGKPAQIAGYQIGGKTGTAQKANDSGTYGRGRITSFVSILPIENPRYVVLAVIDEPSSPNAYGSTVAAPLVKTMMESLVVIEGIPPAAK